GYTYAPLLGLFLIGIFTNINLHDKTVPIAALATPVIAYFLNEYLLENYGFNVGFLTIFTGASITIILLLLFNLFNLIPSKTK
ncbi:MAG: sodium:solute symporter, partial [Weeksellaceae bacterium]